jgi:hypothetical protein
MNISIKFLKAYLQFVATPIEHSSKFGTKWLCQLLGQFLVQFPTAGSTSLHLRIYILRKRAPELRLRSGLQQQLKICTVPSSFSKNELAVCSNT